MIKLENVFKSYPNKANVVNNVTLDIKPGEIFGFIGPNGAGKTTTIKMLVGQLKADSGTISYDNTNIDDEPIFVKEKIAYVPDNLTVYEKLTGMQYLNFIGDIYKVEIEKRKSRIDYYLNLFDLTDSVHDLISSYSKGMLQKLVISAALLSDPKYFILDEPLLGLDPKSSFNLKTEMKKMVQNNKVVFFSTHVLEVAENLCDTIAIINNGKIIYHGKMADLKANSSQSLENLFLELTENV